MLKEKPLSDGTLFRIVQQIEIGTFEPSQGWTEITVDIGWKETFLSPYEAIQGQLGEFGIQEQASNPGGNSRDRVGGGSCGEEQQNDQMS